MGPLNLLDPAMFKVGFGRRSRSSASMSLISDRWAIRRLLDARPQSPDIGPNRAPATRSCGNGCGELWITESQGPVPRPRAAECGSAAYVFPFSRHREKGHTGLIQRETSL